MNARFIHFNLLPETPKDKTLEIFIPQKGPIISMILFAQEPMLLSTWSGVPHLCAQISQHPNTLPPATRIPVSGLDAFHR